MGGHARRGAATLAHFQPHTTVMSTSSEDRPSSGSEQGCLRTTEHFLLRRPEKSYHESVVWQKSAWEILLSKPSGLHCPVRAIKKAGLRPVASPLRRAHAVGSARRAHSETASRPPRVVLARGISWENGRAVDQP